jgi:hypothetical protein
LLEGKKKIYGKYYPVEAKIVKGPAHRSKGLLNWLSELENKPKKYF